MLFSANSMDTFEQLDTAAKVQATQERTEEKNHQSQAVSAEYSNTLAPSFGASNNMNQTEVTEQRIVLYDPSDIA
jgi:hypothetical protein